MDSKEMIRCFTLGYLAAIVVEFLVKWAVEQTEGTVIEFPSTDTAGSSNGVVEGVKVTGGGTATNV